MSSNALNKDTMTTTVCIQRKIMLSPKHLSTLESSIRDKVDRLYGGCHEEYGYVMEIKDIQIDQQSVDIVHSSGNLLIPISITLQTLLPRVGNRFQTCISDIFAQGIITKYGDIEIFVPEHSLESWAIRGEILVDPSDKRYHIGDWLDIEIQNVKFIRGQYMCIGKILSIRDK